MRWGRQSLRGGGASAVWEVIDGWSTITGVYDACEDTLRRAWESILPVESGGPIDPNDKVSTAGFGDKHFVDAANEIHYIIHFENLEEALFSAVNIVITDRLDGALDFESVTIGESSHPPSSVVDNEDDGVITWTFTGIDLPPNVNPPQGEGWVSFSVRPRSDVVSGAVIINTADIVFDTNDPVITPPVSNAIDVEGPQSAVEPLAATSKATIPLRWAGIDDAAGAGIKDYTIYVSDDEGEYEVWLEHTESTSGVFKGEVGHSYAFYSVARDNVGHVEAPPEVPDATTTVESACFVGSLQ